MSSTFERFRPISARRNPKVTGSYADPIRNIDWVLMGSVISLVVIGLFTVFSATYRRLAEQGFDPYVYTQRQAIFVVVAGAVLTGVMMLGHDWFRNQNLFFYGLTILLLVLVLLTGAVTGGARLAFDLGPISIQPAELAKPVMVLVAANYVCSVTTGSVDSDLFRLVLLYTFIPLGLILAQPDLGSGSVLMAGVFGMLFVANAPRRTQLWVLGTFLVTARASFYFYPYQFRRFDAWFNQDSFDKDLEKIVLQVRFAKRAVSTGGLFGKGYLDGPLTNGKYIPVQFTDFPFSAIGEQFGALGGVVVLTLFSVVLWRVWRIAQMARDRFGHLLVTGIFTILMWQVFQNIGMSMGVTPVSGLPLPFISYGGSHLVSSAILVGLAQSVHMRRLR